MALEEEVSLDISDALRQVDLLEQALTASTQSFQVGLVDALDVLQAVQVGDVDASSVTTSIDAAVTDADTSVPVTADTDGVTDQISTAVDGADAEITVTADTTEAQDQIDALAGSAQDAVGNIEGLTEATQGAGQAAGTAGDPVGALGTAFTFAGGGAKGLAAGGKALVSELGPVGIAAAAVAGSVVALGASAIDADTANRRLQSSLGGLSAEIDNLHIAGLGDSLSDIAIAAASDDDALRVVAAGIADLGAASDKTQQQSADLGVDILTLAAKLAVLRPELGTAEDIANRLTPALAKGGKALQGFGLAADPERIKALAQQLAGANNEVTRFDLVAAGAQIAAKSLGASAKDLSDAADAPALTFRRLKVELDEAFEAAGAQVLPDLTEAVTELTPSLVDLVGATTQVAVALGPLLSVAIRAAGPLITNFAVAVDVSLAAIADAAAATFDLLSHLPFVGDKFGDLADSAHGLGDGFTEAAKQAGSVGTAVDDLGTSADDTTGKVDDATVGVLDYAGALDGATASSDNLTTATQEQNDALGVGIDAATKRAQALVDITTATDALTEALQKNGSGSEEARAAAEKLALANVSLDDATNILSGGIDDNNDHINTLIARFTAVSQTLTGPAKAAIDGYIQDLKNVQAQNPHVTITSNIDAAQGQLETFAQSVQRLRAGLDKPLALRIVTSLPGTNFNNTPQHASGGTEVGPTVFTAGEAGRELVFVGQGQTATTISNGETNRLLSPQTSSTAVVDGRLFNDLVIQAPNVEVGNQTATAAVRELRAEAFRQGK